MSIQSTSFVIHKKTFDAKKGDSDIPERASSWLAMDESMMILRTVRRCKHLVKYAITTSSNSHVQGYTYHRVCIS